MILRLSISVITTEFLFFRLTEAAVCKPNAKCVHARVRHIVVNKSSTRQAALGPLSLTQSHILFADGNTSSTHSIKLAG